MRAIKLGNFLLHDIDYIKRDDNGSPVRFKTSDEIKRELNELKKLK